jgi:hypothetical protein
MYSIVRTCARMYERIYVRTCVCTAYYRRATNVCMYESACTYVIPATYVYICIYVRYARTYAFTSTYVRMSVSQYVPQAPFTYSICVCTCLACNDWQYSACTYVLWQRMHRTHLRNERACARIIRMHRRSSHLRTFRI